MPPFEDGRIVGKAEAIAKGPERERDAESVRQEIERFRGRILSAAYGLERELDGLIVWHLFGLRQDGKAGFFDEHILQSLGLERKVRLARLIAADWHDEEVDTERISIRIARAKTYRDRVAHWPTSLQPLTVEGRTVDFRVRMGKGNVSVVLDARTQAEWLAEIDEAIAGIRALATGIEELEKLRSGDE